MPETSCSISLKYLLFGCFRKFVAKFCSQGFYNVVGEIELVTSGRRLSVIHGSYVSVHLLSRGTDCLFFFLYISFQGSLYSRQP